MTNRPKRDSAKSRYRVGIFNAKFTLMKVSKFAYLENMFLNPFLNRPLYN